MKFTKLHGLFVLIFVLSISVCQTQDSSEYDDYDVDDEYNYDNNSSAPSAAADDYDDTYEEDDNIIDTIDDKIVNTTNNLLTTIATTISNPKLLQIELTPTATTTATPVVLTVCPDVCECTEGTQFLNCSHKNLTEIPKNLPINVFKIDLSHNRIENINVDDFSQLTELREIELADNKIRTINKQVFSNLNRLDHIGLSANLFDNIDLDTFSEAKDLTSLNLSFNPINIDGKQMLLNLPELQVLSLEGCNLTEIYENTFENLTNLVSLNLAKNKFTDVDFNYHAFEQLKNLQTFHISNLSQSNIMELCKVLTSIDLISDDKFDISCFELVSGTTFEDSTMTVPPKRVKEIETTSTTSTTTTTSTTVSSTTSASTENPITLKIESSKKPQISQETNKHLNETTLSPLNSFNTTTETDDVKKIDSKQVQISSQSIKHILIGTIALAVAGICIGILFRQDCFGIKTKLCRRRRPLPTDQVRPAEEVPLNKV